MTPSDPKGIAMLLMAKKKPDATADSEGDSPRPLEAAAQDVLDAIKSDDPKQFAEALKAFTCLADEGDENTEE